jgi:hypothetical protein
MNNYNTLNDLVKLYMNNNKNRIKYRERFSYSSKARELINVYLNKGIDSYEIEKCLKDNKNNINPIWVILNEKFGDK